MISHSKPIQSSTLSWFEFLYFPEMIEILADENSWLCTKTKAADDFRSFVYSRNPRSTQQPWEGTHTLMELWRQVCPSLLPFSWPSHYRMLVDGEHGNTPLSILSMMVIPTGPFSICFMASWKTTSPSPSILFRLNHSIPYGLFYFVCTEWAKT